MENIFDRTEMLIGTEKLQKLHKSKVAVVGVGGVGSYAAEGLVRAGIGNIILIDSDDICITNINRQIHATIDTVGKPKVYVMKDRIQKINPAAVVIAHKSFYCEGKFSELIPCDCDYIVDAIDAVPSKISLIVEAKSRNIPIISSMGAGNKLHAENFEIADIYQTSVCPLAKVMRKALKQKNIHSLKVVYSKETPIRQNFMGASFYGECSSRNDNSVACSYLPASISFVPSVVGLIIASAVVRDIIGAQ